MNGYWFCGGVFKYISFFPHIPIAGNASLVSSIRIDTVGVRFCMYEPIQERHRIIIFNTAMKNHTQI